MDILEYTDKMVIEKVIKYDNFIKAEDLEVYGKELNKEYSGRWKPIGNGVSKEINGKESKYYVRSKKDQWLKFVVRQTLTNGEDDIITTVRHI